MKCGEEGGKEKEGGGERRKGGKGRMERGERIRDRKGGHGKKRGMG